MFCKQIIFTISLLANVSQNSAQDVRGTHSKRRNLSSVVSSVNTLAQAIRNQRLEYSKDNFKKLCENDDNKAPFWECDRYAECVAGCNQPLTSACYSPCKAIHLLRWWSTSLAWSVGSSSQVNISQDLVLQKMCCRSLEQEWKIWS